MRTPLIWVVLFCAMAVPIILAAASPLLAWRDPIYIAAGFAGVLSLALLLMQPLLAMGVLPGVNVLRARRVHRWIGGALAFVVIVHVGGLWITSPPDVIDALTFTSATPFSVWGVLAMWALFATSVLAALRKRLRMRPRHWQIAHGAFAAIIATGTIAHALLIEGTMETVSKTVLCALVGISAFMAFRKIWVR